MDNHHNLSGCAHELLSRVVQIAHEEAKKQARFLKKNDPLRIVIDESTKTIYLDYEKGHWKITAIAHALNQVRIHPPSYLLSSHNSSLDTRRRSNQWVSK